MRARLPAVIIGAILMFSASAAFAAVDTTVTIKWNAEKENFVGHVDSSAACTGGRPVKVFKKTANGASLQGKVMANEDGRWKYHAMEAHGKYFAVAPEYDSMDGDVCERDRSETVDVM